MATETVPLRDTNGDQSEPCQLAEEVAALADMLTIASTGDFGSLRDDTMETIASMIDQRADLLKELLNAGAE